MTTNPDAPDRHRKLRRTARVIATPVVLVAAILYFVIDAIFLPITRPLFHYVERHPAFDRMAVWLRRQGPFTTLFVILVPLAILEPAKPVGFYLIATDHAVRGVALLVLAEVIKLALVERLFVIGKPKLMTIRAFAVGYNFVMRWLTYLKNLRAWQMVMRVAEMAKRAIKAGIASARQRE